MTLGEFKKKTEGYPDHLELFIDERLTEFKYGLVNSIEKKVIGFMEDPFDTEPKAKAEVIVFSEE